MSIGDIIKEQRLRKGMTQEELAEAMGYSRSLIARMETGRTVPNINEIKEIAKILGCTAACFLGEEM